MNDRDQDLVRKAAIEALHSRIDADLAELVLDIQRDAPQDRGTPARQLTFQIDGLDIYVVVRGTDVGKTAIMTCILPPALVGPVTLWRNSGEVATFDPDHLGIASLPVFESGPVRLVVRCAAPPGEQSRRIQTEWFLVP